MATSIKTELSPVFKILGLDKQKAAGEAAAKAEAKGAAKLGEIDSIEPGRL